MLQRMFLSLCAVTVLAACDPTTGVGTTGSGLEAGTPDKTHYYRQSGSRAGMR